MITITYIFGMLYKIFWLFTEQVFILFFWLQNYDDLQNSVWVQVVGLATSLAVLAVMAIKYMQYRRDKE